MTRSRAMPSRHVERKRPARVAGRRGYTIVEVMSAMTLFAIGAAGVIGMQRVTIQGGADARHFDVATNIAREWQHRLQRDAMQWTEPNSVVSTSNQDLRTLWLKVDNISNTWFVPTTTEAATFGHSAAFDALGHDVPVDSIDRMFCVNVRLAWIAEHRAGTLTAMIRADIRVFWARLEFPTATCDADVSSAANRNRYHIVQVSTALRGNPNQ